jgi:hypothetical protein
MIQRGQTINLASLGGRLQFRDRPLQTLDGLARGDCSEDVTAHP